MVQEWEAHMRATLEVLTCEALLPGQPGEDTVRAVSALLDLSIFKSFLERSIQKEQAAKTMHELLLCWISETRGGR